MLKTFVHLYRGRLGRGKPNFVLASACGAAAALALPVAGTLSVFFQGAGLLPGGGADDAPVRAAAILLMTVLPVILLFVFAGMLALSILLWSSKWFAKGTIFLGVLFESLLVGGGFAFLSANQFGPADAWMTFALFGGATFVSLGAGSTLWWVLLHRAVNVPRLSLTGTSGPDEDRA